VDAAKGRRSLEEYAVHKARDEVAPVETAAVRFELGDGGLGCGHAESPLTFEVG
jgi:hypothetical protein